MGQAVGGVVQVGDVVGVAVGLGRRRPVRRTRWSSGSLSAGWAGYETLLCVPADSPVSAVNQPVGKCLATNWSAGSPLLLALAGWAPV